MLGQIATDVLRRMKISSLATAFPSVLLTVLTACGVEVQRSASDSRPPFMAVVAVAVGASGCGLADNLAEGFHVDGQRVMTAAHTVRGATSVTVGGEPATLLFIDHRTDIAVLVVPGVGTGGESARFATPVLGPATLLRGRHSGRPVERVELMVTKHAAINIDEPLDSATYRRDGLVTKLDASFGTVTAGDSGGAIVDASGAVIGMMFATDTATGATGYAVSAFELQAALRRTGNERVPTGQC